MVRGEIWWADLPAPKGSAPGKRRPVLVIQSDPINRSLIQTTVVAAITSNLQLARAPGNLLLTTGDSRLEKPSVVNFSQILTVDKSWLTKPVQMLRKDLMVQVDRCLKRTLGLE